MKPGKDLPGLGHPIAFYAAFRKICKTINAVVLLCQLLYWTGKQADRHGWIYKTAAELELETSLTYKEQFKARVELKTRGFLEERYVRSEHRLYFRLNLAAIRRALLAVLAEQPPAGMQATSQVENAICLLEDATCPAEEGTLPTGCSLIGICIDHAETTSPNRTGSAKGVSLRASNQEEQERKAARPSDAHVEWERSLAEACRAFERALGVKGWPWRSSEAWKRLAVLIAEAWRQDADIFQKYIEWAEDRVWRGAYNAKQIRMNPGQFIDTGWPLFMRSRRAGTERVRVETDLERRIREGVGEK